MTPDVQTATAYPLGGSKWAIFVVIIRPLR